MPKGFLGFRLNHIISDYFTFLELSDNIRPMQAEENTAEKTLENKAQDDSSMVELEGTPGKVYEVGYLLVSTIEEQAVPAIHGNLKETVSSLGGEIISDEIPKMIQLAYTMLKVHKNIRNKYDTAYFGWIKFTMDSQKILELKKNLDLDANVIRFLIIKTVKENTIAARRFTHREGGGTSHRKPTTAKSDGDEIPVEINKEEVDREIEAMVAEPAAL